MAVGLSLLGRVSEGRLCTLLKIIKMKNANLVVVDIINEFSDCPYRIFIAVLSWAE